MSEKKTGKSLLNASVMMAGAAYLSYASGLLGSILVARTLGPQNYGTYAYILWLVSVCVSVMNHGLPVSAIKFISENIGAGQTGLAGSMHEWLRQKQTWSMVLLGIGIGLFLLVHSPSGWENNAIPFTTIVMIGGVSKSIYQFSTSVSKGHGLFSVEARTVSVMSIINLVALLGAWLMGVSLMSMLLIYAAISVGYWICVKFFMSKEVILRNKEPLPTSARQRLVGHLGWTIVLTGIGVFNEGSVNIYALNNFVGAAEVGYYTIAAGLTKAGMDLLTVGLSSVLMSAMSHAYGKDGTAGIRHVFQGAVKNFHFFGLLLAGFGLLASDLAVHILYGSRYEASIIIMKVMFVLGGLTLSEGAFASLLSVMDKQRDRVLINGLSLILTLPVSYFLVKFHGLNGAMWAYAINRAAVFLIAAISASSLAGIRTPEWALLKLTLAMVLALTPMLGLLHWFPGFLTGVLACLLFMGGFVFLATRFEVWQPEELGAILKLVAKIPVVSSMTNWLLPTHFKVRGE